jgi:hypothetical protein
MLKVLKEGKHLGFVDRLSPIYDFRQRKFYVYDKEYVI